MFPYLYVPIYRSQEPSPGSGASFLLRRSVHANTFEFIKIV